MGKKKKKSELYDPKTVDITDRTDLADDEYYVEKVVARRIGKNYQTQYRIKWVGYEDNENTWESIENCTKSIEFLKVFEEERLKLPNTNRAKKIEYEVPLENLSKSMIDEQIKDLINSPEDIHDVIGFIPDESKFIIMWKSGYILAMPSTYLNRLPTEKKKLFMDCLANLQEEYVEINQLKADPILMAHQLKKIQALQNSRKEKKKNRNKVAKGRSSYQKRLEDVHKWLAEESDDEQMIEEEDEEKMKELNKKISKSKCARFYIKNVTQRQKNACDTYLKKYKDDDEYLSDDESLQELEENDEFEEEAAEPVKRTKHESIFEQRDTMEEENESLYEEEEEEEVNNERTEEEDESERNFQEEEDRKEKEEFADFVAAATAAAEAIDADDDSDEGIFYPQEALLPVFWSPKVTSEVEIIPDARSESPTIPMEIDKSNKRKRSESSLESQYPPFQAGPSTSTGSRGIGLPHYINLGRLAAYSDSDSD